MGNRLLCLTALFLFSRSGTFAAQQKAQSLDRTNTLVAAAAKGDLRTIRSLIRTGIQLDTPDSCGNTALIKAIVCRQTKTAKYLLDRGAGVNARGSDADTPLLVAARWGDTDQIALLLRRGARVNACDDLGQTPLGI